MHERWNRALIQSAFCRQISVQNRASIEYNQRDVLFYRGQESCMSNTNDGSAPTGNQIPEYPEAPKGQGEPTGSRRASASFTNAPAQVPAPAVAMTSLPPEGSQTPEDIFRIFQLLWRHKILVLCLMAVGTVCGFLLAQRATPVYQSQARLSVVYHAPPKEGWDPGVSENE